MRSLELFVLPFCIFVRNICRSGSIMTDTNCKIFLIHLFSNTSVIFHNVFPVHKGNNLYRHHPCLAIRTRSTQEQWRTHPDVKQFGASYRTLVPRFSCLGSIDLKVVSRLWLQLYPSGARSRTSCLGGEPLVSLSPVMHRSRPALH